MTDDIKRWTATAYYRTDAGLIDVTWEFEEIVELDLLVERGPDWNTLDHVVIRLARPTHPGITIEQANTL